ncbi:MAG: hypothetical protein NT062_33585 [Proteobacteria bacterium]|nr:hypothetical protein [Pseudomonadota bacterium]
MKRVVLLVLAFLVLAPSAVRAAVQYRCASDGELRAACCCPARARHHGDERTESRLRAACCCTLSVVAAHDGTQRTTPEVTFDPAPAVTMAVVVAPAIVRMIYVPTSEYPQVQRGPPETLLARRCALLL